MTKKTSRKKPTPARKEFLRLKREQRIVSLMSPEAGKKFLRWSHSKNPKKGSWGM